MALEYGYDVEFTGVGPAPLGQQDAVGFCTQIGVFRRLTQRSSCGTLFGVDVEDIFSYELVSTNALYLCLGSVILWKCAHLTKEPQKLKISGFIK